MTILIFILILSLLVIVHELGHFIAAKRQGVLVEEFGIGFPPRVFGIKKGETTYSINLLPIGGFVKLYGEEYTQIEGKKETTNRNRAFAYKHPWQKSLIIVAGVIGNFLLGWVLISFLFTQGVPSPINKVLIESVQPNSPAANADLQTNDLVVEVVYQNKKYSTKSSSDLIDLTKKFAGKTISLTVERKEKTFSTTIIPREKLEKGEGRLGIVITSFIEKKYPWYQAPFFGLIESFKITATIVRELTRTLIQLLSFQKPQVDVAGPIRIAGYVGQAVKFGKNAVLEIAALLSLNLAVINILPFPALDGGRLIFALYEWGTKKRVNQKIEQMVNLIGFAILISLAVLISINDIISIYK